MRDGRVKDGRDGVNKGEVQREVKKFGRIC